MSSKQASLTERVQFSFKQLSAAAVSLNNRSDQLGKSISRLDSAIQKLSIGVSAWVKFDEWSSENGLQFATEEIGYAKVSSRWGVAIRTMSGHEGADDYDSYEEWLFNDAPRAMRVKAVSKIPDLFEELTKEVLSTVENLDKQLKIVDDLTSAIDGISSMKSLSKDVVGKV